MHEVLLERAAERDLRRLPPEDFQRVIAALRALADDPRPPGCRKIVGAENAWRVRVGVLRVRHRREAY